MRGVFLIVELLALFGTIGLFANLYALVSFSLLLADSLLGLDVAFVSTFLSPDNAFVLLLVSAVALVLLEPLRAAISAQAFVDARTRRDGADLHAAVDAGDRAGQRRAPRAASVPPLGRGGAAAASAALLAARARCRAEPQPRRRARRDRRRARRRSARVRGRRARAR